LLPRAGGPRQGGPDAADQGRLRPPRHPQPRDDPPRPRPGRADHHRGAMTEPTETNGAHALIRTLVACGVDTCFTNPGTSEMHFVAALDDVTEMRGVLALHENVATGA